MIIQLLSKNAMSLYFILFKKNIKNNKEKIIMRNDIFKTFNKYYYIIEIERGD